MFLKLKFYKILKKIFKITNQKKAYDKYNKKIQKLSYDPNKDIRYSLAYFRAYLFFKQHYGIELPIETCGAGTRFEMVRVKLKDLKRFWENQELSLKDTHIYKFLETKDESIYEEYKNLHIRKFNLSPDTASWDADRILQMEQIINADGYSPTKSIVCINAKNHIIDGLHRSCCMLKKYGPDYEIIACRIS